LAGVEDLRAARAPAMREIIEFRLSEDEARQYLPDSIGRTLG
jgi:hypothetical protein